MITIVRLELYKMLRKKTIYLISLPFIIPLIFGIGLISNLSMSVQTEEGRFDMFSQGLGMFEFADTMLKTANFVFIFTLMIIVASFYAKEIEDGQFLLYTVRIGDRTKILLAKFFAITIIQILYYFVFFFFCFVLYTIAMMVSRSEFSEWAVANWDTYLLAAVYFLINGLVFTAISLLIGTKLKTFPCFASTFILSIVTLFFRHFGEARLLVPEHFAEYVVHGFVRMEQLALHTALFVFYILILLGLSVFLLRKKDL